MFEFLKHLTRSCFAALDYGQGMVHIQTGKKLQLGTELDTELKLPFNQRCQVHLRVMERIPGGYRAHVLGPKPSIELLEKTFLPDPNKPKEQIFYKFNPEDSTHHVRTYVVRSQAFTNYRGVTVELSMSGATLLLDGPVAENQEIPMQLDLDDPEIPAPLNLQGTVAWCKQRDPKTWVASVKLHSLDNKQSELLKAFLTELKYRRPR